MNQHDLYQLLGAKSEEDILRHFPSRYEDLHPTLLPSSPEDGERVVVKGYVQNLKSFSNRSSSFIRFKVKTFAENSISCILFNQPFYLMKLSQKKGLLFVLYYSDPRKAYIVSSIHDLDSYFVMTGIRPIYTLPKGVSNSYFIGYLKKLLSYPKESSYVVSKLPSHLIQKYRLLNEYDAYRCVHLPRNDKDLKEGLRVFKYEEALAYSIRSLALKKKAQKRKKNGNLQIDHNKINSFVKNLSFKMTKDQLAAVRDIILNMEREEVMYRLLQGDVGTGKTIVAFIALYGNYLRGKQGVFMAPTYELALQHYQNALHVFENYPIRISFLAGNSLKESEKKKVLSDLKNGDTDILISTHAAISKNVVFHNLGLTIVDEQQRFGVAQREELLDKGESSDLLMMSATPIPRTLSQIINADLDVSTLSEFPSGTRNVDTKVIASSDPLLYQSIEKAMEFHRQTFVVVPKIQEGTRQVKSAEKVYQDMSERFGIESVQLLHGKIKKENQEEILKAFKDGSKPILVSTTVIEVGIDVKSAGLLIIYDANYFGVSSLHQLRGRIGRSGDYGLCLLVYDGKDKEAKEKLDFIANNNDGLKISQFDLKQRGSGSYSGQNQTGRSELMVCNFVDDLSMFQAAKVDAEEILSHPENDENAAYLKTLSGDDKPFVA